jgi:hypothetical protein
MSLLADGVGFRQPRYDFPVNVRHRQEAEMMDVVSRRNCVNTPESRMLQSARKNDMPVNPPQTRSQLREGHAHLKRDACFFRQHGHWTAAPNCLEHGIKDRADFRRLAVKMRVQVVRAAEVRLIAVCETPVATRTFPKRALRMFGDGTPFHLSMQQRVSLRQPGGLIKPGRN